NAATGGWPAATAPCKNKNKRSLQASCSSTGTAAIVELLEYRCLLSSAPIPVSVETRANTYTTNAQNQSTVATDASGNYVVVWQSRGQDGSGYGIYAQRYNFNAVALGTEFRVNTYTTND